MPDPDALADRLELERTIWTLGRCLDERDFDRQIVNPAVRGMVGVLRVEHRREAYRPL
jgi:hypothetical protein